jgi:transcription elongation GreA/GreB family factor
MKRVSAGTWVKLAGFEPGEEEVFRILPEGHANTLENEISVDSPLARALEGAEAGDKVKFHPPVGEVELEILEVGRL